MSKICAVKVRKPKIAKAPSPSTITHNARLANNIEYLLPENLRQPNYHLNKVSNAKEAFNIWKEENEKRYQDIRGRKLRVDALRMESLMLIFGYEQTKLCNPDEIWQKATEIWKPWFEDRYRTKIRTMDWHRDEAHSEDGSLITQNNHIHVEYDNVNNDGEMVRRLFTKNDLIMMQDKIVEIYRPLGFIRGEKTSKKTRTEKPKRGISQEAYRAKKQKERADKKLKEEMILLSKQLQEASAKKVHYAQIEQLNRELQQLITDEKIKSDEALKRIKEESHKIIEKLKSVNQKKEIQLNSQKQIILMMEDQIQVMKSSEQLANQEIEALKNQKPIIKEVETIREVPRKVTPNMVISYRIKYEGESMTVGDLLKRRKGIIEELESQNTSVTTELAEKSSLIKQFEKEKEQDYNLIYTNETKNILSKDDNNNEQVPITWKEKAKSLKLEFEKLKKEVGELKRIKNGVTPLLTKVLSAFNVEGDDPDALNKINNKLDSMINAKENSNHAKEYKKDMSLRGSPRKFKM